MLKIKVFVPLSSKLFYQYQAVFLYGDWLKMKKMPEGFLKLLYQNNTYIYLINYEINYCQF